MLERFEIIFPVEKHVHKLGTVFACCMTTTLPHLQASYSRFRSWHCIGYQRIRSRPQVVTRTLIAADRAATYNEYLVAFPAEYLHRPPSTGKRTMLTIILAKEDKNSCLDGSISLLSFPRFDLLEPVKHPNSLSLQFYRASWEGSSYACSAFRLRHKPCGDMACSCAYHGEMNPKFFDHSWMTLGKLVSRFSSNLIRKNLRCISWCEQSCVERICRIYAGWCSLLWIRW